jgi:hypothetical protein
MKTVRRRNRQEGAANSQTAETPHPPSEIPGQAFYAGRQHARNGDHPLPQPTGARAVPGARAVWTAAAPRTLSSEKLAPCLPWRGAFLVRGDPSRHVNTGLTVSRVTSPRGGGGLRPNLLRWDEATFSTIVEKVTLNYASCRGRLEAGDLRSAAVEKMGGWRHKYGAKGRFFPVSGTPITCFGGKMRHSYSAGEVTVAAWRRRLDDD